MAERKEEIFMGKTEEEINEFLTLEGELIIELDKLPTPAKRAILDSLRQLAKLPDWIQAVLLEDINTAVANRIGTMEMIIKSQRENEPYPTFRMARDVAREQKKE